MSPSIYTTKEEEIDLSLLQFLKRRSRESGKRVKRAIDASACTVNGVSAKYSTYRMQRGDKVMLYFDRFEKVKKPELELLYEDRHFKAYNKPAFYVCDGENRLHRLDKGTSGVLLESEEPLFFDLFRERKIEKEYICVVEGNIQGSGVVKNHLGVVKRLHGQKIMGETLDGKVAITKWWVLASSGKLSLVRCDLVTGRTHQIRAHMASLGAPVVGDYQYGDQFSVRPERMLLHARSVKFTHPILGEKIEIKAPLPPEILEYFGEDLCC